MMTSKVDQIRTQNDRLRQNLETGVAIAVITVGVADEAVGRIVKTIAVYDDFCHENDPHEEHDFGAFEAEGHTMFFKIDYYDRSLTWHSDDPADSTITHSVITIMLAEEY